MQNSAQQNALGRQEREAAQGILRQSALNREADTRVAQTTQQIAASNPDAERNAKRATYTDALRKSLGLRSGAVPVNGAVSDRYAQEASDTQDQTEADAAQLADTTAAIEAPIYQRQNEGVAVNNAGVDLSMLKGRSAGQDYLTRLRMAMQRPNGGLMAGGQLLSGAGGAFAGGGGFGGDGADMFDVPTGSAKKYGRMRGSVQPGYAGVPA